MGAANCSEAAHLQTVTSTTSEIGGKAIVKSVFKHQPQEPCTRAANSPAMSAEQEETLPRATVQKIVKGGQLGFFSNRPSCLQADPRPTGSNHALQRSWPAKKEVMDR